MTRQQKQLKRHFGQLSCEWCGKWTNVWPGISQNEHSLKLWNDKYKGELYFCKREKCILMRPDDWQELKAKYREAQKLL